MVEGNGAAVILRHVSRNRISANLVPGPQTAGNQIDPDGDAAPMRHSSPEMPPPTMAMRRILVLFLSVAMTS